MLKPISGHVEIDETLIGGRQTREEREEKGTNNENRTIITTKRMVSNFLRSRKKNAPAQGQMDGEKSESSPAFV